MAICASCLPWEFGFEEGELEEACRKDELVYEAVVGPQRLRSTFVPPGIEREMCDDFICRISIVKKSIHEDCLSCTT